MQSARALLIGCGSIGKQHFAQLRKGYSVLAVVDPTAPARAWALSQQSDDLTVAVYTNLADALASGDSFHLVTVANWGPDHLSAVRHCLEAGAKTFVIEKPLADSIADARAILREVRDAGAKMWVNLTRRYSQIAATILDLAAEHNLGQLQDVVATGGARCLATNGIHHLDLAAQLFETDPTAVTADLEVEHINPRHPGLVFVEGVMSYRFPGGRRFTCVFSNDSSVNEEVQFYWTGAVGVFAPTGDYSLRTRVAADVERFPAVTRTGPASVEVFAGNIAVGPDGRSGLDRLYKMVQDGEGGEGSLTTEWLLGALHASDLGRRMNLPLRDEEIDVERHWAIS